MMVKAWKVSSSVSVMVADMFSSRRSCSVSSILRTKDSLGPSSSTISDRVYASLVISKIASTSNMLCELAADPVGFQYTMGMPLVGPGVMVFE